MPRKMLPLGAHGDRVAIGVQEEVAVGAQEEVAICAEEQVTTGA